ncbi:MAG: hypothetical protein MI673_09095, partial [Thiotrichales bacterium]|nr:hypothetical protein [Thiotrichales bacterium]
DYLKLIVFPTSNSFSVFHDDYPVASGILTPGHTLLSIILIIVAISFALMKRSAFPVYSFAILWFFAGHLLESGIIGLELYFEHRNYLPSFGIIFFIGYTVLLLSRRVKAGLVLFLAGIYIMAVAMVAVSEIQLWRYPQLQAAGWLERHPQSRRALNHLWNLSLISGDRPGISQGYREFNHRFPDDPYPVFRARVLESCYGVEKFIHYDQEAAMLRMQSGGFYPNSILSMYVDLFRRLENKQCRSEDLHVFLEMTRGLLENENYLPIHSNLLTFAGIISYHMGDQNTAIDFVNRAIQENNTIDNRILLLKFLDAGNNHEARDQLMREIYAEIKGKPLKKHYYKNLINRLNPEKQEQD